MSAYWPWWAGALALGSVATLHARLSGRPMGVSGTLAKVAHPRESLAADRLEDEMSRDRLALEAALLAATAAEFGEPERAGAVAPAAEDARSSYVAVPPAPFAGNVVFLISVAVGALLASASGEASGPLGLHASLGPEHERLFGSGAPMLAVLAVGGVLVGAGTRMSGGCTSGHGLSGCARLVPSSLVATATFLGVAVATSLLLSRVVGW